MKSSKQITLLAFAASLSAFGLQALEADVWGSAQAKTACKNKQVGNQCQIPVPCPFGVNCAPVGTCKEVYEWPKNTQFSTAPNPKDIPSSLTCSQDESINVCKGQKAGAACTFGRAPNCKPWQACPMYMQIVQGTCTQGEYATQCNEKPFNLKEKP